VTTLVWNHLPECETEREDIVVAVETVFRSAWLILGDSERGFEDEYPITVSNTAAPTAVAIDSIGAVRVFVDIDLDA